MVGLAHLLDDPSLSKLAGQAGRGVTQAIYKASERTDVDFGYLMEQAAVESSFRPEVKAKTSSATGLFQFIESTWLRAVKTYGDQHGLGQYAEDIDPNGNVNDPVRRAEILDLRKDPVKASLMAAELASENKRILENTPGIDHDIGATELYLAHFLGAGGATKFLEHHSQSPDTKAASILPAAAKSNQAIFYHADGRQKTTEEVYQHFAGKFQSDQSIAAPHSPDLSPPRDVYTPRSARIATHFTPVQTGRHLNDFQKAFLPYQANFDRAVSELLLSDTARMKDIFDLPADILAPRHSILSIL